MSIKTFAIITDIHANERALSTAIDIINNRNNITNMHEILIILIMLIYV